MAPLQAAIVSAQKFWKQINYLHTTQRFIAFGYINNVMWKLQLTKSEWDTGETKVRRKCS